MTSITIEGDSEWADGLRSLANARAEAAALRTRVEVLQEVVRRMDACWQQPRIPWQPGSECEAEFIRATNPTQGDET